MFKKLKERTPRLTQKKWKLILYIVFCVFMVLSLTVLPAYMWMTSDIETRGITSIRGESMTPTICDNDILYVQPVKFERGEIVVAKCPSTDKYTSVSNVAMLKRIVGLPGETIEITSEGVLIDGELIIEDYTDDQKLTLQDSNDVQEIILSDYEYFLLGDNRSNSFDSRHVGAVPAMNFLYGLTLEPNDYTHMIWKNMAIVAAGNLLLIISLPILLFVIMTYQKPSRKSKLERHQNRTPERSKNVPDNGVKDDGDKTKKSGKPQPKSAKNRKKIERAMKAQKTLETEQYIQTHKKH